MEKVTITVNGQKITVPADYTVMRAAEDLGIDIPRLCFLKDINETSACRLCVVDVTNMRGLKNSCTLAVYDGMEVHTDSEEIQESIVSNLQLLASNHIFECWACEREHNCELLDLMRRYNVENVYGESISYSKKGRYINDTSSSIVLDSGKCVLCGRCISACQNHTGLGILDFNERGNQTYVGPALFHSMEDSGCIYCGKCIEACPVAAIKEKSHIDQVLDALKDNNKTVVVAPDPSVFVTVGEEFGLEIGTNVEAKVYAALKKLGVNEVFDMRVAQDISIQEQAAELLQRIKDNKELPLYTSCAPGFINYVELYEQDYLDNVTKAKSAQQVAGAVIKHHYAEKLGLHKEDVVVVTIMPSIAKKDEADRSAMKYEGTKDVDYVLTTRELARLLKRKGITLPHLTDESPFGELAQELSSVRTIPVTDGITTSVLQAASELANESPQAIKYKEVRGQVGVKEATYTINGQEVHVAVVYDDHTLPEFFARMKRTKKDYHFVEFLASDYGCITGGGQPLHNARTQDAGVVNKIRYEALKEWETNQPEGNNQVAKALYQGNITEPGSKRSKDVLHTEYQAQKFYK